MMDLSRPSIENKKNIKKDKTKTKNRPKPKKKKDFNQRLLYSQRS